MIVTCSQSFHWDCSTEPPKAYFAEKRKSRVYLEPEEPRWRRFLRMFWRARWLVATLVALAAYVACPLNTFANGVLAGVLLTIITHFTVSRSTALRGSFRGKSHLPF